MALTNYLDPATNPDVAVVAGKGGEALQLNADGAFSLMSYGIYFTGINLAIILTIVIILAAAAILVYMVNKGKKKAMKAIV